ncbi:MAG: AMP-binding protein, partial [Alphaproteobacteria bacterium]|nr:AMP-binding protein [Alphaproteobacteria bacterium]
MCRAPQDAKHFSGRVRLPTTDYRSCPNLVRLFFDQAAAFGDAPFLWSKKAGGWTALSWNEVARNVRRLASALAGLGVVPGDRVLLLGENRPEWAVADLAIMAAGAVTVPAYTTSTVDDYRYLLANVGARGIIASTQA